MLVKVVLPELLKLGLDQSEAKKIFDHIRRLPTDLPHDRRWRHISKKVLNKKYPIAMLMDACRRYIDGDPRRRITFEYTMLDGVNDSRDQAVKLARLLGDMPAKVNLIPYNHVEGLPFRCPHGEQIATFQDVLVAAGILCMTRKTRGSDISAACGQLVGNVIDRVRRSARQSRDPGNGVS